MITTNIKSKKKKQKQLETGRFYINSTFNNTSISLTDSEGNVVAWESAGKLGFKGSKRGTPYAAGIVTNSLSQISQNLGLKKAELFVKGVGNGRDNAIRQLMTSGIELTRIKDITPLPHNGTRPKKPRRV